MVEECPKVNWALRGEREGFGVSQIKRVSLVAGIPGDSGATKGGDKVSIWGGHTKPVGIGGKGGAQIKGPFWGGGNISCWRHKKQLVVFPPPGGGESRRPPKRGVAQHQWGKGSLRGQHPNRAGAGAKHKGRFLIKRAG